MADSTGKPLGEGDQWLANTIVESINMSLEAMTSERPETGWRPAPDLIGSEESSGWSWWEQPLTAASGAVLWVATPEATWRQIGNKALAAAGIDDASDEDSLGTWKEILGQTLSGVAQAMGRRLRREVTCGSGQDSKQPAPGALALTLTTTFSGSAPVELHVAASGPLRLCLQPQQEAPAPQPSTASSQVTPSAPGRTPNLAVENSRTLGLLLEVELPVSVSFGRAQLPLKDVLKLNSGSIVELNRAVNEPVEIIVNNCVIARGEVVVVEGNYGVRIKQIISKEERLRTLY